MPAYVYVAAASIVGSVILLFVSLRGNVPNRLARANLLDGQAESTNLREIVLARPAQERVVGPAVAGLAAAARRITPRGVLDEIDRRIQLAGISERWPMERVLAAKLILATLGASIGLIRVLSDPSAASVFLMIAATIAGFLAPEVVLSRRSRERQEVIQRELPDVLDQVTICVEAGLGFEAALDRAARSGRGALAEELARTLQDIRLGMSRQVALGKLLERTDVADLRHFVVAIGQAERHGLAIAKVLRVQSQELRQKRRQRAEEKAMKLPVKLLFPLMFCIMPALFIVLIGPAVIRIGNANLFGQ
jgi:tight adherence protein C